MSQSIFNAISLPPTSDQINDKTDGKYIPESMIAKQLRKKLSIWTLDVKSQMNLGSDNIKYNYDYNVNKQIDIKSKNIGDDIIVAFSQIYNKYINGDTAIYMINVSSRSRRKPKHLFDTDYYYKTGNTSSGGNDDDDRTPTKNVRSVKSTSFSFKFSLSRSSKQAKQEQGMSFIKQTNSNMENDGNDGQVQSSTKTEFDLIEWLLQTILPPMEQFS